MMLPLLQNKAIYLHLAQAVVCLPVTETMGKDDLHDRRTNSDHHILPDNTDIAARINCSRSSLAATVNFLSKVTSLLGG